jgi:hypothetical protein
MFRPKSVNKSVNIVDVNNAEKIRDGDELRNINSFEYLLNIANKIVLNNPAEHPAINTPGYFAPPINTPGFTYNHETYHVFLRLKNFFERHKKDGTNGTLYDPQQAYGNIYTHFLETLGAIIPEIEIHRRNMFYQCRDYQTKISQASISAKSLSKQIATFKHTIKYYEENREETQYDHRYERYQKIHEDDLEKYFNDANEYQIIQLVIADKIINDLKYDLSSLNARLISLNKNIETYKIFIEIINKFLKNFDQMIDAIYANPNHALERSANMIGPVIKGVSQTSNIIKEVICDRLKGNSRSRSGKLSDKINYHIPYRDRNQTTPQNEETLIERGIGLINPSFKPLKKTSIPSIREYEYKKNIKLQPLFAEIDENEEDGPENNASYPLECRMGTQGEYHHGDPRVSPIFEAWLRVQKRKREAKGKREGQTRITHIYFNNLALDRESYEGKREAGLTLKLHELEKSHDNVVAVITLPADHGLMDQHFFEHHQKTIGPEDAFNKMLNIAEGSSKEKVKDFYISEDIKKLLYGNKGKSYDKDCESRELARLLNLSFQKLGLADSKELSEAELQAVYFHFIKFELTDFIISKLQPDSFNMSCKDGIDRAGVSSSYYNLIKSIEAYYPLTEKEFIRALHGAPTMVKGRGMNHHSHLIWNAIDVYVNANANNANVDMPNWLIEWRNQNAPPHTKQHYVNELKSFIQKNKGPNGLKSSSLFKTDNVDHAKSIDTAKQMLDLMENNHPIKDINLTFNNKDLNKLRTDIEKDYLFDFTSYVEKPLVATISTHYPILVQF